jgi:cell division protein FtsB
MESTLDLQLLLARFLLWILYPAWLLAGGVDYLCHRRTDIAATAGTRESLLHIAEFITVGAALTIALLLEPTRGSLAAIVLLVAAHSALVYIDVRYTQKRRFISPLEQQIHGYMEVIPVIATGLFILLHWPALAVPRSSEMFKLEQPFAGHPALLVLGSFILLGGIPLLTEFISTLRQRAPAAPPDPR